MKIGSDLKHSKCRTGIFTLDSEYLEVRLLLIARIEAHSSKIPFCSEKQKAEAYSLMNKGKVNVSLGKARCWA